MAKSGSARSAKSKTASSSSRLHVVKPQSASSRSVKPMRAKRSAIATISASGTRTARIDWSKVDKTSEADIARQAREDRSSIPSDRAWRELVKEGRVKIASPAKVPAEVDVRAIRKKTGLSQSAFAARFGFTAASVRQWEQGRRQPHGPARVLLTIIDREPGLVSRALA